MKWYEQVILDACTKAPVSAVSVRVYVTGSKTVKETSDKTSENDDKSSGSNEDDVAFEILSGRPPIWELFDAYARTRFGRVGAAVCGPMGLTRDVGNSVASVQIDILRGKTACEEMYLQTELFTY